MGHFADWLRWKTGWSLSAGWAWAIEIYSDGRDLLEQFFEFMDEFRQLSPRRLAWVATTEANKPTGRRVVYGFDGRMERPERIDLYQYHSTPLHFFRFHRSGRQVNERILDDQANVETSQAFAVQWVLDELGVERGEWTVADHR